MNNFFYELHPVYLSGAYDALFTDESVVGVSLFDEHVQQFLQLLHF